MRLEELYPDFSTALPEVQLHLVARYRQRRAEDMAKPNTYKVKKKKKPKKKAVNLATQLTENEKVLMKTLGLKKKQILAMRKD